MKVFSSTVPEKPKSWTELTRHGRFAIFHPLFRKSSIIEGGPFGEKKLKKSSQCRKKIGRGPLGFFKSHSVAKPLENIFFRKKVSRCRRKRKRGPFSLAQYCMLRVFKIVKGKNCIPFGLFENPVCCKISKKMKGPFGDIKIFRKLKILKQSHSAEILERGDPLGFLKLRLAEKYQKT